MKNLEFYFWRWFEVVYARKLKKWEEIREEELSERKFAEENAMEPEFWCWHCKYGDCEQH